MRWTRTRFAALGLVMVTALGACTSGGQDNQPSTAASTEAESAPASPDGGEPEEGAEPEGDAVHGGEDVDVPESPWEQGEFVAYTMEGATLTFTLAATDGPADVEKHRENIGQAPVTYLSVKVDNTESPNYLDLYEVQVLGEDGGEHVYTYLSGVIDGWEQNDDSLELSLGFDSVTAPGEEITVWFAGEDEMPEKISEVKVTSEAGVNFTYAFPVA